MPFRDLPGVTTCKFQKGEYLIRAGETIDYVYYLITGNVYRELMSASGRIRIMNNKAQGNIAESIVGILVLFEDNQNQSCMYDFVAYEDCTCYRIPVAVCLAYLRENVQRMEQVTRTAVQEYMKLVALFQAKDEGQSAKRLCSLLLEWGQETEAGVFVPKTWNNIKIAKFLSVHTVTVARMLRALKEEGVIERKEQGILLKDIKKLQQYVNEEIKLKYK